jgi:hypothetical protein
MLVRDGRIVRVQHEEPFATLLGSHKGSLVELIEQLSNPEFRSGLKRLLKALGR